MYISIVEQAGWSKGDLHSQCQTGRPECRACNTCSVILGGRNGVGFAFPVRDWLARVGGIFIPTVELAGRSVGDVTPAVP